MILHTTKKRLIKSFGLIASPSEINWIALLFHAFQVTKFRKSEADLTSKSAIMKFSHWSLISILITLFAVHTAALPAWRNPSNESLPVGSVSKYVSKQRIAVKIPASAQSEKTARLFGWLSSLLGGSQASDDYYDEDCDYEHYHDDYHSGHHHHHHAHSHYYDDDYDNDKYAQKHRPNKKPSGDKINLAQASDSSRIVSAPQAAYIPNGNSPVGTVVYLG